MSGGMTAAMTGAIGAMIARMIVVTGAMTAGTAVPDPGCCDDSSGQDALSLDATPFD